MLTILAAVASAVLALGPVSAAPAVDAPAHHCSISGGQKFCDPNEEDLSPHWPAYERLAGADRYDTSAAIAYYTQQPDATYLIVASGLGIDAIAAGTHLNGPLVLVPHRGSSVPASVLSVAASLNPDVVLFLGGEDVVTPTQAETILDYIVVWNP